MPINSKSNGFLVSDRPLSVDTLALGLGAIHDDTSAILALMLRSQRLGNTGGRGSNLNSGVGSFDMSASAARSEASRRAAENRQRDKYGRFVPAEVSAEIAMVRAVRALNRVDAEQAAEQRKEAAKRAATNPNQTRDANGRFIKAGGAGANTGNSNSGGAGSNSSGESSGGDKDKDKETAGLLARIKSVFGKANGVSLGDYDKVDPNVEAAKEAGRLVGGAASVVRNVGSAVIGRPFAAARDKSVSWLSRILATLKLTRRDIGQYGLTETRLLRDIDRKQNGDGKSGGGGLGGLLGRAGGSIMSMLGKGGGGLLGLLKGGAGGLLGMGKFAMRRLPVLGALFAGGSALASMFGPDDPSKSAEQNRQDRFTGAGSGIGALIGGGLGTLVGGPVGTLIGGVIGDKVGELVGGWLATFDWADIGKQITTTWGTFTSNLSDTWKGVTDKFSAVTKTVGDAFGAVFDGTKKWLKDKTGIDVDAATKSAGGAIAAAWDKTKEVAGDVGDYLVGRAKRMYAPIGRVADAGSTAAENVLSSIVPGYRRSATFDGIKGGESLAKNGSYTNDEAAQIKALKSSGANTSANLPGGMPADVQAKIIAAAQANGLDPKMMLKIAAMESGGNVNAISSTGAIGLYQETGKTASGLGVKDRFNADQNIAGAMKLTRDNMAILQKSGLPATPENLYMMHQLGPAAARELIAGAANGKAIADLSDATRRAVGFNYGAKSKTASDYLAANGAALTSRYNTTVGTSMPTIGAPPAMSAVASMPPPLRVPTFTMPPPPTLPPTASAAIPTRLSDPGPTIVRLDADSPIHQDMRDRDLAQIATGGISG